jgi:hypothetical protein
MAYDSSNASNSMIEDGKTSSRTSSVQASSRVNNNNNTYQYKHNNNNNKRRRKEEKRSDLHNTYNIKSRKLGEVHQ